jgi:hypothetical protein
MLKMNATTNYNPKNQTFSSKKKDLISRNTSAHK